MTRAAMNGHGWTLWIWMAVTIFTLLTMPGCVGNGAYHEKHEITDLTIVFLDEHSLQTKWKDITGGAPGAPNQASMAYKVQGAYDYRTNTIYCMKMDFEVCGRELHSAVLGKLNVEAR